MALCNKYDFVMLFDVKNGNPNGDPDAGNSPRFDAETGLGIITDVCLKYKVKRYIELVKDGEEGYDLLYKADRALEEKFHDALSSAKESTPAASKNSKQAAADKNRSVREYLCKKYVDARMFGAVIAINGEGSNHITGPVQFHFAESISPIHYRDISITRCTRDKAKELEKNETTMGKKSIIPYALYRAEGHVSAALANKVTNLSEEDLELLWSALINMFEEDHSAARGKMCMRRLYVFRHDSVLGNCPSHLLFDKIKVAEVNPGTPPRSFDAYSVTVDSTMPAGVTLIEKL